MKQYLILLLLALFNLTGCATKQFSEHKLVIAHRGASGYLPEHSLAAKAMAYAMAADYIEQDVVMTKDDHLIILHGPFLDPVTDVMTMFPNRFRQVFGQKRWLTVDFTLKEIKSLKMTEVFLVDPQTGKQQNKYPDRFPLFTSTFTISTLAEELELIQGLNKSTGKNIGIYVEIKAPWFHHLEGKDISKATLKMVKSFGYQSKNDKAYIQCFDPDETRRINDVLMPELKIDLNLVLLIDEVNSGETMRLVDGELEHYNIDWMFKPDGMEKIAKYADGIGPWKSFLVDDNSTKENLIVSDLVKQAHAAGMKVHPFTFRSDAGRIPGYADSFEQLLDIFLYKVGVDGIFTDFPDKAVDFIRSKEHP